MCERTSITENPTEKHTFSEALTTINLITIVYQELSLIVTRESVEVTTFAFALDTKHMLLKRVIISIFCQPHFRATRYKIYSSMCY